MATETTTPQPSAPQPSKGDTVPAPSERKARRSGRWSGYRHLLWVRLLELKREPEIVFWVFGFPLLLSLGLGIAFRNKPADKMSVAVVAGVNSEKTLAQLSG